MATGHGQEELKRDGFRSPQSSAEGENRSASERHGSF